MHKKAYSVTSSGELLKVHHIVTTVPSVVGVVFEKAVISKANIKPGLHPYYASESTNILCIEGVFFFHCSPATLKTNLVKIFTGLLFCT